MAALGLGSGLVAKLNRLIDPDFSLLMARWEAIMREDNTRGVMAGLAGDDATLAPVTYRTGINAPLRRRNRYAFGNLPPQTSAGDNLTSAEYRRLTGPPLAPRGLRSRVVTNYVTRSGYDGREWFSEAAWLNVVDRKGRPFLIYHFEGRGRLPRRDLRGVRAWGRAEALKELRAEVGRMLRGQS